MNWKITVCEHFMSLKRQEGNLVQFFWGDLIEEGSVKNSSKAAKDTA